MLHTWTVFLVFKIILILCVYGWCIYVCVHACGNPHTYLLRPEIVIMTFSSVISILQFRDCLLLNLELPVLTTLYAAQWPFDSLCPPHRTGFTDTYCQAFHVGARILVQTLRIVQRVFSALYLLPKPAPYIFFYFFKQSCFTYQPLFSLPPHLPLPPTLYPTLSSIHLREGESSHRESAKSVVSPEEGPWSCI